MNAKTERDGMPCDTMMSLSTKPTLPCDLYFIKTYSRRCGRDDFMECQIKRLVMILILK